ncbi:MAG TPA: aminotransferase class III-fold pyridoxal phosphate-dependent enzyme, partial [Fodinibius sp.]|nr:aminotransferase class III-fold pyridoxal phosphate-dependent enzyme [Fodinibius sp.]
PAMTYPETEKHIRQTAKLEERAIAQAERYFELYRDEIACIIIEPIQAEGGDNHFRPEFHQALRDLADEHEALLIYDEVQTGVGLTGKFWAYEHYVKPDILAFGKKTQVCGILASKRVDEVEANCFRVPSRINSTWGGNLVDMVRFGRILEVIEEENLVGKAAQTGDYLLQQIRGLADQYEVVNNARGKGLFCAIDFPNTEIRDAVIEECFKNHLMILSCGTHTMRFRPPLNVNNQHIDEGMDIIEQAIQSVVHTL